MSVKIIGMLGLALLVSACGHKEEATPVAVASATATSIVMAPHAPSAAPTVVAPLPTPTPAPTAAVVLGVPTQAEEAVAAGREINKTNYKKELEAIDKEVQ